VAEGTLTDVAGVQVGHFTDAEAETGVTVMTFPEPNVAVADVRGGAPGTREIAAFGDAIKPVTVNALVFSGGSAFGLAAADGVMAEVEREGRGAPTPAGPVPIVPTAIVYDLMSGEVSRRPGAAEGATAYRARASAPVEQGRVGAGTGVTVANWRGVDAVRPSGVGSAAVTVDGAIVAALVVLNSIGDIFTLDGRSLTGGDPASLEMPEKPELGENTTLVCVATDASLRDRNELRRCAIRAHDALAACIRPTHTRYDGDSAFVVACGEVHADVDALQQGAFVAVGMAIESAVTSSPVPDGWTPNWGGE
jgi:L-aminopeptidase/D-esterase-like protein